MRLSPGDRSQIEALIEELDLLVPREGARVFTDHLDPVHEDPTFRGNALGFLRYGIELCKAGVTPGRAGAVHVEIDYLAPNVYEPLAKRFERADAYERPPFRKVPWTEPAFAALVAPILFFTILLLAIGFMTVMGWIVG
jgi:hypothetical protein